MLTSVLSFTVGSPGYISHCCLSLTSHPQQPEQAAEVTEYCIKHSNDVSSNMKELWDWTCEEFETSDKMSSPLQGATMKFLAEHQRAKRGTNLAPMAMLPWLI